MRIVLVLSALLAGCVAGKPTPCRSPPLLTGSLSVATQDENLWMYAKFLYDELGERMRLFQLGNYQNHTFQKDYLLLYREGIIYDISDATHSCKKQPLKKKFVPWKVPENATLMGQSVIGSSSGPGQGLLVNSWTGRLPEKFFMTVTEFGCIPVSMTVQTKQFGWMVTSFFDNVIGITDPGALNPPSYCDSVGVENVEPLDFFSLFHQKY